MKKIDIVNRIAQEFQISHKLVKEIIDSSFEIMSECLMQKEEIDIYRFGSFKIKTRLARKGINPSTGSSMIIPARDVIKFKPTKKLRF